jgi:hypothetical protein
MELSVHAERPVEFVGRVASCQPVDKDGQEQYDIGIEFIGLTEKDRAVLASFIEKSAAIETGNDAETGAGSSIDKKALPISPEIADKIEYLYKWHTTMGYYRVLDIKEYATAEQIRQAFLAKTQEFHPDKFPDMPEDLKHKLNEICAYINAAYSTLMDPRKRKEYDRTPISKLRH